MIAIIRLIIEGETDKAEYIFWRTLLDELPHGFKIYSAFGDGKGIEVTKTVMGEVQTGDIIILGLDRYTWATYKACEKLLRMEANRKNFDLMKLGAGSFEGMFVSYKPLLSMVRSVPQLMQTIFNDVSDYLWNKRSFSSQLAGYRAKLAAVGITTKADTQEQFLTWLLGQVTRNPRARYITKSGIGKCWLISCCDAQPNTKAACLHRGTTVLSYWDKICDLEAQSLMKYNTHKLNDLRS